MTVQQLIVKGGQLLGQGKTREALLHLKQAEKKAGRDEKTDILLFEGYVRRYGEFVEKGMPTEANAMQRQAAEYFPGVEQVGESLMALYVGSLSGEAAFDAYGRYLEKVEPSPVVERVLADSLLLEKRWDCLALLGGESLLNRDGEQARRAVELMEKADWESAGDQLKSISRTSPFAPFRMFCRAMTAFHAGDDKAARRAISMIPKDFRLNPLLEKVDSTLSDEANETEKRDAMLSVDCLWDGPVMAEHRARDLIHELSKKAPDACSSAISALAESVFPENPEIAAEEILHIIWPKLIDVGRSRVAKLRRTAEKVLNKKRAELLSLKFSYLFSGRGLREAGEYIKVLNEEFPDAEERNLAHSLVLRQSAASGIDRMDELFYRGFFLDSECGPYLDVFGIESINLELAPIELVKKSIELDPENREGYELLARVPYSSHDAKNAMEEAFSSMMEKFPEDPFPCLELADLYYSKNAFRKAENVLKEAMKRAPHDNRVLDRHALAFVVSAEKNFKRGNYHLSWPDLEKARDLNRPKMAALVAAKRTVHKVEAENADIHRVLTAETENFSKVDTLRTMAMVLTESKDLTREGKTLVFDNFQRWFRKEVKSVSKLSSAERLALISPLEKHHRQVCKTNMPRVFLEYDPKLLKGISDEELPYAIDMILDSEVASLVYKELDRRVGKKRDNGLLVLEFYRAAISHMLALSKGGAVFRDIVARASDAERKKLEEAARRLAPHAQGKLKAALGQFKFGSLDDFFPFPGFDDFDVDFEDDDFEDDFEDVEDYILDMIDRVEDIIDELGLRRAPDSVLKGVRKDMMNSPIARDHEHMAETIRPFSYELSHKAQILLYGKVVSRS